MQNKVQLLGISNAIVDILAQVTDEFLEDLKAQPGSMILIDELTASDLYKKLSVRQNSIRWICCKYNCLFCKFWR